MIKITFNGQVQKLAKPITIHELLEQHNITNQFVAVAVNQRIVHKENYSTLLSVGDQVECVSPMQGG